VQAELGYNLSVRGCLLTLYFPAGHFRAREDGAQRGGCSFDCPRVTVAVRASLLHPSGAPRWSAVPKLSSRPTLNYIRGRLDRTFRAST